MDRKRGLYSKLTSYGDDEFSVYLRKVFLKSMGYSEDSLERPIVGIVNTYSAYNSCHATVPSLVEAIKRGVMLAGGMPFEFPVISLHESFAAPTSMYLRNMMSMDVEEMLRALPMDACVLIGGCDKTVPALLMGAASADVPSILEVTGPMLTGSYQGERVGACTDCRRFWGKFRAGEIAEEALPEITDQLGPTPGTCMVMGTASTMALMAEGMGLMLPGGASIPAVNSERIRHAEKTGAEAVALAARGTKPSELISAATIENAARILLAVGGSTNAVVHLAAVAGRLGIDLDLDAFDRWGRETPMIVDLKPSGTYYMQELHQAGGLATVLKEISNLLDLDAAIIEGGTLRDRLPTGDGWAQDVVSPAAEPFHASGSIAVLKGNLAPGGALIKQSAASADLLTHKGRAVVFDSLEDMASRIDDPALDVTADDILVLRNAGPVGAPGMPEAGYLPIPMKLARAGVKDMVRISDARMSGTAFGSIVLHVTPESAIGGPLALVRTGDEILLDAPNRRLELLVDEAELEARRAALGPVTPPTAPRGYRKLFLEQVLQADKGCDFAFLAGKDEG